MKQVDLKNIPFRENSEKKLNLNVEYKLDSKCKLLYLIILCEKIVIGFRTPQLLELLLLLINKCVKSSGSVKSSLYF